MLQTEHPFTLPVGYQDEEGTLHRDGVMRMASAGDEIPPVRDPRVQANEAYLIVILLSRVITRLGTLAHINPKVIEDLYAIDLAFLQDFYNELNRTGAPRVPAACPQCEHEFELELNGVGGS